MALPKRMVVRVAVPFPALVEGSGPVSVTKSNGVWTIGFTVSPLNAITPPVGNYATDSLIGWDAVAKQFFQISLTQLLSVPVTSPPRTVTAATDTASQSDASLIFNNASGVTETLPAAASNEGRWLYLRTIANGSVVSASSNVVPLAGGAAGTAILAATAGKWAALQSDGSVWQIMAAN